MKGVLFGDEATYRNMFGSFLPGSDRLGFPDGEFYKPIGPLADKLNRAATSADPMEGLLSNISRVLRKRQNASYLVVSGQVTCIKNGAPLVLRSLPDSVRDGIINWGCARVVDKPAAIERSKAIRMDAQSTRRTRKSICWIFIGI